ncbi:hypothetical protein PAPYR_11633 [Paratrimastix pyriformis]|uniref:Uncharacterized protein n=1 Tax=Paratrimastix pyriformis TaxID=342808 RepID=A0ABQ8U866_9EUKA|nr:hypothetical protein PAPYR_11633 [Paratrimastix pyriformis]
MVPMLFAQYKALTLGILASLSILGSYEGALSNEGSLFQQHQRMASSDLLTIPPPPEGPRASAEGTVPYDAPMSARDLEDSNAIVASPPVPSPLSAAPPRLEADPEPDRHTDGGVPSTGVAPPPPPARPPSASKPRTKAVASRFMAGPTAAIPAPAPSGPRPQLHHQPTDKPATGAANAAAPAAPFDFGILGGTPLAPSRPVPATPQQRADGDGGEAEEAAASQQQTEETVPGLAPQPQGATYNAKAAAREAALCQARLMQWRYVHARLRSSFEEQRLSEEIAHLAASRLHYEQTRHIERLHGIVATQAQRIGTAHLKDGAAQTRRILGALDELQAALARCADRIPARDIMVTSGPETRMITKIHREITEAAALDTERHSLLAQCIQLQKEDAKPVGRGLNPGLLRDRQEFCHYTTPAALEKRAVRIISVMVARKGPSASTPQILSCKRSSIKKSISPLSSEWQSARLLI